MKIKGKIGRKGIAFLSVSVVVLFLIWYYIIGISTNHKGSFFNKGHNAVWIGHEWVGQYKSNEEVAGLVENLRKHKIDTVFVHTGPIREDGTIDPVTFTYAVNFLEKARATDGGIHYQAWLGQIRNKINLDEGGIRAEIAKQSVVLTKVVGFDGIHFDIEPVWDEDEAFISLLKETREVLPEAKKISVALAEFIPSSFVWLVKNFRELENYNTQINYRNVAKYADQVVAMAYDTSIKKPWFYRWLVQEQTIWLTDLLDGREVFIGIPAYDKVTENFDPQVENVENVENGLRGIVAGLNNIRSEKDNFAGVAIYPYWEIEEEEWRTFENLWLK